MLDFSTSKVIRTLTITKYLSEYKVEHFKNSKTLTTEEKLV